MENPMSWGKAEHIVHDVIEQHHKQQQQGIIGLSLIRKITDALRQENLLKEDNDAKIKE